MSRHPQRPQRQAYRLPRMSRSIEKGLWPNGPICPICASADRVTTRKWGQYRCNACNVVSYRDEKSWLDPGDAMAEGQKA